MARSELLANAGLGLNLVELRFETLVDRRLGPRARRPMGSSLRLAVSSSRVARPTYAAEHQADDAAD